MAQVAFTRMAYPSYLRQKKYFIHCIASYYPAQPSLSKLLKCMASAKCSNLISSLPARSAMVRDTLRMRS